MTGWPSTQLRHVARFTYGDSLADHVRQSGRVPVFGSNGVVGEHDVANTEGPVIVIGRKGSHGKLQYSEAPVFAIDTTFYVDQRSTDTNMRWLFYALSTVGLGDLSQDVGVPGLSREAAYSQRVPVPPKIVQQEIADYLDAETARIDALLQLRRRQLDLLSVRDRSATAEEIANLMQHGPVVRGKHLLSEVDERVDSGAAGELLSVSIYRGVVPRRETTGDLPRAEDLSNYKKARAGDVVVNRMRAFQGGLGASPVDGVVSPDYAVLRCSGKLRPAYIHHLFRSEWFVGQMIARLRGIGSVDQGNVRTPRINVEDLLDVLIPCPQATAQDRSIAAWDRSVRRTDAARKALDRQMLLLREHRQALVTAAVTGEIDTTRKAS